MDGIERILVFLIVVIGMLIVLADKLKELKKKSKGLFKSTDDRRTGRRKKR